PFRWEVAAGLIGGDGGVIRRVKESGVGDRVDRVSGSIFGVGRKTPPEKFSGDGGGGRRWWGFSGNNGEEREISVKCVFRKME
ncbi:hypothetical protein Tco_0750901, partial [Tanacetum coccineum]